MCVFMSNADHPRPFDPAIDMDFKGDESLWYARPQLIFSVTVCPTGKQHLPETHEILNLVFFSTFELIKLTPDSILQRHCVPMLFEASGTDVPTLYLAPLKNVLGRVPLMPCYLRGNDTLTILPCISNSCLPQGAKADGPRRQWQMQTRGSKLFEVNMWLWRYGQAQPRSVAAQPLRTVGNG